MAGHGREAQESIEGPKTATTIAHVSTANQQLQRATGTVSPMTDQELLSLFESCELPHEQWTHRAHVRVAYMYLNQFPFSEALGRSAIRRAAAQRQSWSN